MTTHAELVEIAQTIDTGRLKLIQRHQRAQLLRAQRQRHRGMTYFYEIRVNATAEVLQSRKQVSA